MLHEMKLQDDPFKINFKMVKLKDLILKWWGKKYYR